MKALTSASTSERIGTISGLMVWDIGRVQRNIKMGRAERRTLLYDRVVSKCRREEADSAGYEEKGGQLQVLGMMLGAVLFFFDFEI